MVSGTPDCSRHGRRWELGRRPNQRVLGVVFRLELRTGLTGPLGTNVPMDARLALDRHLGQLKFSSWSALEGPTSAVWTALTPGLQVGQKLGFRVTVDDPVADLR